ncbi:MAG: disulfide bond formation protein B [Pseudomonadota bacterium]|nr:disulfide bond formation protein B [Pseudomonadota bacterium]
MTHRFVTARWLALFIPVALMAGALGSQYIGHLYPCELCWYQRYPHLVAIPLALLAFVVPGMSAKRAAVLLAAVAIAVSGVIGVYHAGTEYHWWQGLTECTSTATGHGGSVDDMLARIMKAPVIRCDIPQWTLFGISLAGFNAIISLAGAGTILALLRRRGRR